MPDEELPRMRIVPKPDAPAAIEPADPPLPTPINGPTAANLARAQHLLELYRLGKIDGIVIATAREDATLDAMFVDAPSNAHTTRTLFCSLHAIADHLMRKIL